MTKRSVGGQPQENGMQMSHISRTPEERGAELARRIRAADNRKALEAHNEVKHADTERRREARRTLEQSHDLATILDAWREVKENGDDMMLSRRTLRVIDMHLTLTDAHVDGALVGKNPTYMDLTRTVDLGTSGTNAESVPLEIPEAEDPFGDFRTASEHAGRKMVEIGADARTEREHRLARIGVETALHAFTMRHFLHVLDTQIGPNLAQKLTGYERSLLKSQRENILQSSYWSTPNQEMARTFAAWEALLDETPTETVPIPMHPAYFKSEPAQGDDTVSPTRLVPSFWQNLMNAPNDIGRMIFDEDGARTGKGKKKE